MDFAILSPMHQWGTRGQSKGTAQCYKPVCDQPVPVLSISQMASYWCPVGIPPGEPRFYSLQQESQS